MVGTDHMVELSQHDVWLFANRFAGGTATITPGWEQNRDRQLAHISPYIGRAAAYVYMKPLGVSGFVDLDIYDDVPAMVPTDGFITTNPNLVLQANPADCGEIAVSAFSRMKETPLIALLHVNRVIAGEGSQVETLDYLCAKHDIEPGELSLRFSPSGRKESYAFPEIPESQKVDPRWDGFMEQDTAGNWHVDFHGRTIADFEQFGINQSQMQISPVDTIADPNYFSRYSQNRGLQARGNNCLLYALRSDTL